MHFQCVKEHLGNSILINSKERLGGKYDLQLQ